MSRVRDLRSWAGDLGLRVRVWGLGSGGEDLSLKL